MSEQKNSTKRTEISPFLSKRKNKWRNKAKYLKAQLSTKYYFGGLSWFITADEWHLQAMMHHHHFEVFVGLTK